MLMVLLKAMTMVLRIMLLLEIRVGGTFVCVCVNSRNLLSVVSGTGEEVNSVAAVVSSAVGEVVVVVTFWQI